MVLQTSGGGSGPPGPSLPQCPPGGLSITNRRRHRSSWGHGGRTPASAFGAGDRGTQFDPMTGSKSCCQRGGFPGSPCITPHPPEGPRSEGAELASSLAQKMVLRRDWQTLAFAGVWRCLSVRVGLPLSSRLHNLVLKFSGVSRRKGGSQLGTSPPGVASPGVGQLSAEHDVGGCHPAPRPVWSPEPARAPMGAASFPFQRGPCTRRTSSPAESLWTRAPWSLASPCGGRTTVLLKAWAPEQDCLGPSLVFSGSLLCVQ